MRMAITGASGYVESSFMEAFSPEHEVIGMGYSNPQQLLSLDVRDAAAVLEAVSEYEPEMIIHSAVKMGGEDASEVTVAGTRNVVRAAEHVGASLVFLSSAAVFNGQEGYFAEDSPVGSAEMYGKTKIAAEELVFQAAVDHLVIRPSLAVGIAPHTPQGNFSGRLKAAITAEAPALFDDAWKFSPSWLHDLTATIRWWIDNRNAANLLHIGTSEVTTQLEFGCRVAAALDVDPMILAPEGGPSFKHNVLDSRRARDLGVPLRDLDMVVHGVAREIQEARHD